MLLCPSVHNLIYNLIQFCNLFNFVFTELKNKVEVKLDNVTRKFRERFASAKQATESVDRICFVSAFYRVRHLYILYFTKEQKQA